MWLTYLAAKAEVPGLNQAHERDIEGGGLQCGILHLLKDMVAQR